MEFFDPYYIKKVHDVVLPLGFEVAGKDPLIFYHPNYTRLIDLNNTGYDPITIMSNILYSANEDGFKRGKKAMKIKINNFVEMLKEDD